VLLDYVPIFIMVSLAGIFGLVLSKASEIFGPKKPNPEKLSTYESGMQPIRTARERFSVKFYLVAMLFILFDVEIVFLYPWAAVVRELRLFGFIEMLIFVAVLLVGYVYILKKGALRWD